MLPKLNKHTGGKWLINGNKQRKDIQLQSLEHPVRYHSLDYKFDTKAFHQSSTQYSNRRSRYRNIQDRCVIAKPEILEYNMKRYY